MNSHIYVKKDVLGSLELSMISALFGKLFSIIHSNGQSSNNNRSSSVDIPKKGPGIPHSRSSFVPRPRKNEDAR